MTKGFRTDLLFTEGRERQRQHAIRAGHLSRLSPKAHHLTMAERRKRRKTRSGPARDAVEG